MTDREFDTMLRRDMDALPPAPEITHAVNPWRRAMNRVLWGMGLTTLTLNFWNLDILLSAIGTVLMLLGYRALRKENCWFRVGFFICIAEMGWELFHLFLNSTIYSRSVSAAPVMQVLNWVFTGLVFVRCVCLFSGIHAVQRRAGQTPHGSAVPFIIWYAVTLYLGLADYSGLLAWVLIAAYIGIIRSLYKLSGELNNVGYIITPAPPKWSDRALSVIIAVAAGALMAVGFLFLDEYPMDWQPAEIVRSAEGEQIRQELADLGAPEQVIDDLTAQELLQCAGAAEVTVGYSTQEELSLTTVAIRFADSHWKIIHHFQWTEDPGFRGTESVYLKPAEAMGQVTAEDVSGRLLWGMDGSIHTADYHAITAERFETDFLFRNSADTGIFAVFSLPEEGQDQRGYLMYDVAAPAQDTWAFSWMRYTHQTTRLQFPVQTAMEFDMTSTSVNGWAFSSTDTIINILFPGK